MDRETANKLSVGDRVKTNDLYSVTFPQAKHTSQLPRRGAVVSRSRSKIRVLWDGNRTVVTIHHSFLNHD
jgi:hypothetical protein